MSHDKKEYCIYKVPLIKRSQPDGVEVCKAFNSKLPFPKTPSEVNLLQKLFPGTTFWISIQDSTASGKKENWKDLYTGENIGNSGVPRRDLFFRSFKFLEVYLKLCSRFWFLKFDLKLKWHPSSPRNLPKGQKQGGVVSAKIKNRVIDLPESNKLEVLCVQKLVPGSIG